MNTINTIEDLLQLLDEKPEWVDALRTRLLTPELIELPEQIAQLAAEVRNLAAEVKSFIAATNQRFNHLEQRFDDSSAESNQRFDRLEQRFDDSAAENNQRFDHLEQRIDDSSAGNNQRFDRLENRMQSLQDDVGVLKGAHARSAALREASSIAREMGFQRAKNLTQDNLWTLIDRADTLDIPTNELRSFRNADLIMEAIGSDGKTCYIAVEISFTVNGRDTRRALRNAEFLTRLTGQQAYPAIAGLYKDDRIRSVVESGEVFWYQLAPEVLEAE